MSLIKCKECKAEISNKAKSCPQCGAPIKLKTSPIAWAILAIMITIIVIGLITVDSDQPIPNTNNSAAISSSNTNINNLTLAYLNRKVYDNPVECKVKIIEKYEVASCRSISFDGKSMQGLWLIQDGKFLAINGTSRSLVETKLKGINEIELYPLPLPDTIDIVTILKDFD